MRLDYTTFQEHEMCCQRSGDHGFEPQSGQTWGE